jgi:hypothetical protein
MATTAHLERFWLMARGYRIVPRELEVIAQTVRDGDAE